MTTVLKGPEALQQIEVLGPDAFEPRSCGPQYVPGQRYIAFLTELEPGKWADSGRNFPRYLAGWYGLHAVVDGEMRLQEDDDLRSSVEWMTPDEVKAAIRSHTAPAMKIVPVRAVVESGAPVPRLSFSLVRPLGNPANLLTDVRRERGGIVVPPSFSLSLPEGERRLTFSASLPVGYSVKSMTSGEVNLLQQPLVVGPNTGEIVVTFATAAGALVKVSGRVTGFDQAVASSRRPIVSPTVTLSGATTPVPTYSVAPQAILATDLVVPVNNDGSFEIEKLPPGTYSAQFNDPSRGPLTTIVVPNRDSATVEVPAINPALALGRGGRPVTPTLRGRVVIEGPRNPWSLSYAVSVGGAKTGIISNEAFTLSLAFGDPPGEKIITVDAPGYEVKSMTLGATKLVGGKALVGDNPTGELVITLAVMTPATKPLP